MYACFQRHESLEGRPFFSSLCDQDGRAGHCLAGGRRLLVRIQELEHENLQLKAEIKRLLGSARNSPSIWQSHEQKLTSQHLRQLRMHSPSESTSAPDFGTLSDCSETSLQAHHEPSTDACDPHALLLPTLLDYLTELEFDIMHLRLTARVTRRPKALLLYLVEMSSISGPASMKRVWLSGFRGCPSSP